MSVPVSPDAAQHGDAGPRKPEARRRRRWWLNGKLWIGVLGTALGAAATLGVTELAATLFPRTDRMSRLSDAIRELTGEMQHSRDEVARLANQLRAQEPGSPGAAETARQLEASADALVARSDSLSAVVMDLAGSAPPATTPAPPVSTAPSASIPVARSTSEVADSAPAPDLWLPSHQSTMIGDSRNSFGVRFWGTGINISTDQIEVALNGVADWMHAGDRLQFPDSDEECYIIYLRTVDPDPNAAGDERHGFALTCAPISASAQPR